MHRSVYPLSLPQTLCYLHLPAPLSCPLAVAVRRRRLQRYLPAMIMHESVFLSIYEYLSAGDVTSQKCIQYLDVP